MGIEQSGGFAARSIESICAILVCGGWLEKQPSATKHPIAKHITKPLRRDCRSAWDCLPILKARRFFSGTGVSSWLRRNLLRRVDKFLNQDKFATPPIRSSETSVTLYQPKAGLPPKLIASDKSGESYFF